MYIPTNIYPRIPRKENCLHIWRHVCHTDRAKIYIYFCLLCCFFTAPTLPPYTHLVCVSGMPLSHTSKLFALCLFLHLLLFCSLNGRALISLSILLAVEYWIILVTPMLVVIIDDCMPLLLPSTPSSRRNKFSLYLLFVTRH